MNKLLSTVIAMLSLMAFVMPAAAQPKFAKKVAKGIVSVNTYDRQGNLLHQGTAFYVGANGEAMADYNVFKGAYKATVIDAQGKQADVDCVLGADDTYSLVRFRVNTKGNAVLSTPKTVQGKGATFYALAYSNNGTTESDVASVSDTAMIDGKYIYYGLGKVLDNKLIGSPVFTADGDLIGILHAPIGDKSYVMDIRYKEKLQMAAIPSRSASIALSNIFLPKGLPDTAEEALVYMYFKQSNTTNSEYLDMANRFISSFPKNAEGYYRRATALIDMIRFDEAESDLQNYLTLVADKATGHYNVASKLRDKLTLIPEPAYDKWTYDVVLSHVDKAIELNNAKPDNEEKKANNLQYNILKAQSLMGKGNHDAAIALYEQLNQGETASPSFLYSISMAREARGDSVDQVIEPLDSSLAQMGEPLPAEAANYVMRRGQLLAGAGRYREAVKDYNQYCYLVNNRVNDRFYYERSQIEINGRLYQQALSDLNMAIDRAPNNVVYQVAKASLCIQVNMLDECIEACQRAITLNSSITDSYRILGYALLQKGDKDGARKNLQQAVDMGDENAKSIMEKYLK